ncbi:MAG: succinyl-CoA synthetase beta subunit, partial [Chloroflexota bacterium]|nr:succinyl-CoA synthetase beta subunit [Chloroflexota bacterium]
MQDDEGPCLRLEAVETAFELVTVGRGRRHVAHRRGVDRGQFHVDAVASEPACLIDTGTHEQPVQPGVETVGTAQGGQVTPSADERLLDGVLRLIGIAQDEPGGGIQPGDRGACQRGEGVMIAPPRSLHEFLLHHALGGWLGRTTALNEYGEAAPHLRSVSVGDAARRGTIAPPPPTAFGAVALVKIQEADAKTLLVAQGLPVPGWEVAHTVPEARAAAERILGVTGGASAVVIKAQVLVGGRGKAGGVKLASTVDEAERVAAAILGMDIKGITVRKVLVAEAADIVREYYMSAVLDRGAGRILLMGSAEGGVEIEQVAIDHPEAIIRRHADPLLGLLDYQAREFAFAMGLGGQLKTAVAIAKGLVRTMLAYDADLVEINPLAIVRERDAAGAQVERLVCLDAKVTLDDSALPRHPDLERLRDPDEEDPADREAREAGLTFIKLDGTIGCMVNGAGLAMTTMDLVKRAGGEPANFLDIGGGARADKVAAAMRIILGDPKVDAILVNIFGGITRGDEVARGLIEARAVQERDVPMVVRIVGTNAAEAAVLLEQADF